MLTDDEISEILLPLLPLKDPYVFARAVEAAVLARGAPVTRNSDEDLTLCDERLERGSACGAVFDVEDHTHEDDGHDEQPPQLIRQKTGHEFDDDAVCIHCGFDSAEWHHWKHHTYEGKAQPEAKPPLCTRRA